MKRKNILCKCGLEMREAGNEGKLLTWKCDVCDFEIKIPDKVFFIKWDKKDPDLYEDSHTRNLAIGMRFLSWSE